MFDHERQYNESLAGHKYNYYLRAEFEILTSPAALSEQSRPFRGSVCCKVCSDHELVFKVIAK